MFEKIDVSRIPEQMLLRKYLERIPLYENLNIETSTFLSVIIRTQGKRNYLLKEALMSLANQSDNDFEIIIVGHKMNEQGLQELFDIIKEQSQFIREHTRIFNSEANGRADLLNFGFDKAEGCYLAVLDDDDYVLDNWVEEFHKAGNEHYGNILHSYVLMQQCEMIRDKNGNIKAKPLKRLDKSLCYNFDYTFQMNENGCPLNGLAFPSYAYRNLGIKFDVNCDVLEDWDFLMRMVPFTGIYDIEKPTAVYRIFFKNGNSHSEYDNQYWKDTRSYIRDKLNKEFYPISGEMFSQNEISNGEEYKVLARRIGIKNAYKILKSSIAIYLDKQ